MFWYILSVPAIVRCLRTGCDQTWQEGWGLERALFCFFLNTCFFLCGIAIFLSLYSGDESQACNPVGSELVLAYRCVCASKLKDNPAKYNCLQLHCCSCISLDQLHNVLYMRTPCSELFIFLLQSINPYRDLDLYIIYWKEKHWYSFSFPKKCTSV